MITTYDTDYFIDMLNSGADYRAVDVYDSFVTPGSSASDMVIIDLSSVQRGYSAVNRIANEICPLTLKGRIYLSANTDFELVNTDPDEELRQGFTVAIVYTDTVPTAVNYTTLPWNRFFESVKADGTALNVVYKTQHLPRIPLTLSNFPLFQVHWYFLDIDQRDKTDEGFITPADRYESLTNPEDGDTFDTERLYPMYFRTKKVPAFSNHFDIEMTGDPIVGASTYSGGGAVANPTFATPINVAAPGGVGALAGFLVPTTVGSTITDSGSTSFNTTNVLGSIPATIVGNPTDDDRWIHYQTKDPSIDPEPAWYDKTTTTMTHYSQRKVSTLGGTDTVRQVFAYDTNSLVKPLERFVDFEIDVRRFKMSFNEEGAHDIGAFYLLCRGDFPWPGSATLRARFRVNIESRFSFLE